MKLLDLSGVPWSPASGINFHSIDCSVWNGIVAKNKVAEKMGQGWEVYDEVFPFASGKGKEHNIFWPGCMSSPGLTALSELNSSDNVTPLANGTPPTASQMSPVPLFLCNFHL